jgi:dienelactone hydrolase
MRVSFRIFALLVAVLLPASLHAQVKVSSINDGTVVGQLFVPGKVPAPAIFVLHTAALGGPNAGDLTMAKALAEAGFVAFAIRYDFRIKKDGGAWVQPFIDWLKARPEAAGQPLGAVGFSAGGARVFWFAAREPTIKAVVSYYGTYDYSTSPSLKGYDNATSPIRLVPRIQAASLLLNGGADTEVPVEQVERMKQAVLAKGLPSEAVIYPGVYHMFDRGKEPSMRSDTTSNGTHVAYDGAAAKDAQARTIAWFKTYLR